MALATVVLTVSRLPVVRDENAWRRASRQDTAAGFWTYLNVRPDGRHAVEARLRYDERSWAEACAEDTVQGFERYLRLHTEGRHIDDAKAGIEALHWRDAVSSGTVAGLELYLGLHPGGRYAAEAGDRIDGLRWREAEAGGTVRSLQLYIDTHPSGPHAAEAASRQALLRADAEPFLRAQRDGTFEALKAFVEDYPGHRREAEARAALRKLAGAAVAVDYPKTVAARGTVETNGRGPIYEWSTVFKETGGRAGFKLTARDFHIRDAAGGRWSNNWSETVDVRAGGTASVRYWCDRSDNWAGGTFHTVWIGEDDWGHPIRVVQEVKLAK